MISTIPVPKPKPFWPWLKETLTPDIDLNSFSQFLTEHETLLLCAGVVAIVLHIVTIRALRGRKNRTAATPSCVSPSPGTIAAAIAAPAQPHSASQAADGLIEQPWADVRDPWQQLCEYTLRCIEAESAQSLVPYKDLDKKWFCHLGSEKLIIGHSDNIPAPSSLSRMFESSVNRGAPAGLIYGWPTVVLIGGNRAPNLTPLFFIRIEHTQGTDKQWELHASTEPEFNVAITASGILEPYLAEEVREFLGNGWPFGDEKAAIEFAEKTADILGLDIVSPMDPVALDSNVERRQGVYNAAISVSAKYSYNSTLLEELRKLGTRKDWIDTAAAHLIPTCPRPQGHQSRRATPLAAPVQCNLAQERTLDRLRHEPLTIVTGPPGTGKTQLLVNAVSNAWLDGDKVLVTSTNNPAVDVAVTRAQDEICAGLLLRTGNSNRRKELPDCITLALDETKDYSDNLLEARGGLEDVADERSRLAENLQKLDTIENELLPLSQKLQKTRFDLAEAATQIWPSGEPATLRIDPYVVRKRAQRLLHTIFFRRFRSWRLRRLMGCPPLITIEQILTWSRLHAEHSAQLRHIQLRKDAYNEVAIAVGDPTDSVPQADEKWLKASLRAVRAQAATTIGSAAGSLRSLAQATTGSHAFQNFFPYALAKHPGWACTTLSAGTNFPLESGLFDLIIIDEASQCSLAAVLPLAYRAKRLGVIGDPYQLQPIVNLSDNFLQKSADNAGFDNDDLRARGLHHKSGSAYLAFRSAAGNANAPVLLDEHYRCHPHIARWFNKTFYNDQLVVLTRIKKTDRAIWWQDVAGEAKRPGTGNSWGNLAEADEALNHLADLLESGSSVGVVTPFAAQVGDIERRAEKRFGRSKLDEARFTCATVHRFQGDERDAIIISAVLAPGIEPNTVRWVERDKNLLNVAVSRARQTLIVLGHPEIDRLGSPTLASLRHYLRDELVNHQNLPPASSDIRVDSMAEQLLLDAMRQHDFEPYGKLSVEGYELDFAVMQPGLKLNIEVDGDQHLDARGKQRRQDLTRDRVLVDLDWNVLRIPAWRCHENIDSVIDEINQERNRLLLSPQP